MTNTEREVANALKEWPLNGGISILFLYGMNAIDHEFGHLIFIWSLLVFI